MQIRFAPGELGHPPRQLKDHVTELVRHEAHAGPERRAAPRHRVIIPVSVIPATADGEPTAAGFRALTRDISTHGVCLLSVRPVESSHMVVQFVTESTGTFTVLVEIVRQNPLGPLFETAGRFLVPIAEEGDAGQSFMAE